METDKTETVIYAMKRQTRMVMLASMIVMGIILMLLFVPNPRKQKKTATNIGTENTDVGIVGTKSVGFESLIAESKASAVEKTSEGARLVDGEWVKETATYLVFKRIPIDAEAPEVAEYIKIARVTVGGWKIYDDLKPITEIQGETIVVTFPWRPPEDTPKGYRAIGPNFCAEVIIDIKTKDVLSVLGG